MEGGGVVKEVQQVVRHRLLPPTMPCSLSVSFCSTCICIHSLYYLGCNMHSLYTKRTHVYSFTVMSRDSLTICTWRCHGLHSQSDRR